MQVYVWPSCKYEGVGVLVLSGALNNIHIQSRGLQDVTISPQSPLFMLDPARRSILGLFQARTPLAHNLDPSAFVNWADPINRHNPQAAVSSLPWQVSFSVVVECPPVFIDDPDVLNGLFMYCLWVHRH